MFVFACFNNTGTVTIGNIRNTGHMIGGNGNSLFFNNICSLGQSSDFDISNLVNEATGTVTNTSNGAIFFKRCFMSGRNVNIYNVINHADITGTGSTLNFTVFSDNFRNVGVTLVENITNYGNIQGYSNVTVFVGDTRNGSDVSKYFKKLYNHGNFTNVNSGAVFKFATRSTTKSSNFYRCINYGNVYSSSDIGIFYLAAVSITIPTNFNNCLNYNTFDINCNRCSGTMTGKLGFLANGCIINNSYNFTTMPYNETNDNGVTSYRTTACNFVNVYTVNLAATSSPSYDVFRTDTGSNFDQINTTADTFWNYNNIVTNSYLLYITEISSIDYQNTWVYNSANLRMPFCLVDYINTTRYPISQITNISGNDIVPLTHQLGTYTVLNSSVDTTLYPITISSNGTINLDFYTPADSSGFLTISFTASPADIYMLNLNIVASCFLKGTKILTENEGYIPIEECVPGTFVKTTGEQSLPVKYLYHKKLHHRHTYHLNNLYILRKQDYEGAIDDLIVTGGHPILVDKVSEHESALNKKYYPKLTFVDDKIRLLSVINEKAELNRELAEGIYDLYDIIFEGENRPIYANGILTESMSQDYYDIINGTKKLKQ